jgi:uncharacterized protein
MRLEVEAVLLRIFVAENDRYRGKPMAQAIVSKALENHMAGATVFVAHDGFGRSRSIRTEINDIDAGPRLPVVIELVDSEEKINGFLLIVHQMIESGLVTLERVRALKYLPQAAAERLAATEAAGP